MKKAHLLLLLLLPWLLLALNHRWIYTPAGADPWYYYGYMLRLPQLIQSQPAHYFDDRLSWLLPGYVLHQILPPLAANLSLHFGLYYLSIGSLYITLSRTLNSRVGLWAAVTMGVYLPFMAAVGWHYIDGAGLSYLLLTLAFCTLAAYGSRAWLLGAGAAFAAAVFTNLSLGIFALWIGVYFLFTNARQNKHNLLISGILAGVGAGLLTLFLGLANVSMGGDFVFFADSLKYASQSGAGRFAWLPEERWITQAHYMALPLVVVGGVGLALLVRESRPSQPEARFFGVHFGLALLLMAFLNTFIIQLFIFSYYVSYLIPALMLGLAGLLSDWVANLRPRPFAVLIAVTIAAGALPLVWGTWRDLALSYEAEPYNLLLSVIILLPGFLVLLLRRFRWAAYAVFVLGLSLVGYRAMADPTFAVNPTTTLEGDDKALLLTVYDSVQFLPPDTTHIWAEDALYPLSTTIGFASFVGTNPLTVALPPSHLVLEPGQQVVILWQEPAAYDQGLRAIRLRRMAAIPQAETRITHGPFRFYLSAVRADACHPDTNPPPDIALPGTVFYPANDYTTQAEDLRLQRGCMLTEDEYPAHDRLWGIFAAARDEVALNLTAPKQQALAQWRTSKDPAFLTGIADYILVSSQWVQFLTDDERRMMDNNYELVESWNFRFVDTRYFLYRGLSNAR